MPQRLGSMFFFVKMEILPIIALFCILAGPPVMIWGPCNNTVIGLVIGQVKFGFWFGGIEIFLSSQIIIWGRWVWEWAVWQFAYHHQGRMFETQCALPPMKMKMRRNFTWKWKLYVHELFRFRILILTKKNKTSCIFSLKKW